MHQKYEANRTYVLLDQRKNKLNLLDPSVVYTEIILWASFAKDYQHSICGTNRTYGIITQSLLE